MVFCFAKWPQLLGCSGRYFFWFDMLVLFAIILNMWHWVLPFSELLCPERALYFYVVPFGLLLAFVSNQLEVFRGQGRFRQWWIAVVLMMALGFYNLHDRFLSRAWKADLQMDAPMLEAMQWIDEHTEGDGGFTPTITRRGCGYRR